MGSFPGKASFRGLDELTADELETLWPERERAGEETLAAAAGAWEAFRAPEPTALAGWAGRDAPGVPFLAPALRRMLEELPAPGDGLSGTERRLLPRSQPATPRPRLPSSLRRTTSPLPSSAIRGSSGPSASSDRWPNRLLENAEGGTVRLTEAGERVLAGEADRVELLGIDRWIGGTHVTAESLWRWNAHEQTFA